MPIQLAFQHLLNGSFLDLAQKIIELLTCLKLLQKVV